jgi:hypothetical protein
MFKIERVNHGQPAAAGYVLTAPRNLGAHEYPLHFPQYAFISKTSSVLMHALTPFGRSIDGAITPNSVVSSPNFRQNAIRNRIELLIVQAFLYVCFCCKAC